MNAMPKRTSLCAKCHQAVVMYCHLQDGPAEHIGCSEDAEYDCQPYSFTASHSGYSPVVRCVHSADRPSATLDVPDTKATIH